MPYFREKKYLNKLNEIWKVKYFCTFRLVFSQAIWTAGSNFSASKIFGKVYSVKNKDKICCCLCYSLIRIYLKLDVNVLGVEIFSNAFIHFRTGSALSPKCNAQIKQTEKKEHLEEENHRFTKMCDICWQWQNKLNK